MAKPRTFARLKDAYQGRMCAVMGNGPSMTIGLFEQLVTAGIYTFSANGFCAIFPDTAARPDAVCMSNFDAIRRHGTSYPPACLKFFKAGAKRVLGEDVPNVYELPFSCSHSEGRHGGSFIKDGHFSLDPSVETFCGDTVLLDFAIPVAYFMGFSRILLCGVDCDYTKGHLSTAYDTSVPDGFRGMSTGDHSIAIPSYRYTYEFLTSRGCDIKRLTPSRRLDFIPVASLDNMMTETP